MVAVAENAGAKACNSGATRDKPLTSRRIASASGIWNAATARIERWPGMTTRRLRPREAKDEVTD